MWLTFLFVKHGQHHNTLPRYVLGGINRWQVLSFLGAMWGGTQWGSLLGALQLNQPHEGLATLQPGGMLGLEGLACWGVWLELIAL